MIIIVINNLYFGYYYFNFLSVLKKLINKYPLFKYQFLNNKIMGYDASVYLMYGIKIKYTTPTEIMPILELVVPDLIEEYGEEDIFSCFDTDPHTNGYYCINFESDENNNESELFVACFFHEHITARGAHDCLEVNLPSLDEMNNFNNWCTENNIDEKPKFYTKLYESY